MPLNAATLESAIASAMSALPTDLYAAFGVPGPPVADAVGKARIDALAAKIIERVSAAVASSVVAHLQANAVVTLTAGLAVGAIPGGAGVPVTGTGTIG